MKTVIEMAREAGFHVGDQFVAGASEDDLGRFAELVRADAIAEEREACAKVVDAIEARCIAKDVDDPPLAHVAAAIRARSDT